MLDVLDSFDKIPFKENDNIQRIFDFDPMFVLTGPTCAGKSTLASFLVDNYCYFHIEASDFMWLKFHQKHGVNPELTIGEFATNALKENPSIVTDQILQFLKEKKLQKIVISGFRSEKEIELIKEWDYNFFIFEEVYIDADIEIRFERELARNRKDKVLTKEKFVAKDEQQFAMGLDKVEKLIKNKIINEGSIKKLFDKFKIK